MMIGPVVVGPLHGTVGQLVTTEALYISGLLGQWTAQNVDHVIYWSAPVHKWFTACDQVKVARVGTRAKQYQTFVRIRVPGDPQQTGKVWLGGFRVEKAD